MAKLKAKGKPTCKNCPHWGHVGSSPGLSNGICRRYPPTLIPEIMKDRMNASRWPTTLADAHCGEHPRIKEALRLG